MKQKNVHPVRQKRIARNDPIGLIRPISLNEANNSATDTTRAIVAKWQRRLAAEPKSLAANSQKDLQTALIVLISSDRAGENLSGLHFEAPASMRLALRGVGCSPTAKCIPGSGLGVSRRVHDHAARLASNPKNGLIGLIDLDWVGSNVSSLQLGRCVHDHAARLAKNLQIGLIGLISSDSAGPNLSDIRRFGEPFQQTRRPGGWSKEFGQMSIAQRTQRTPGKEMFRTLLPFARLMVAERPLGANLPPSCLCVSHIRSIVV